MVRRAEQIGRRLGSKTCQNLPSNLSKPVLKPVAARADYQLAAPLRHGLSIAAATTGFDGFSRPPWPLRDRLRPVAGVRQGEIYVLLDER
jgi:hypothetical protein